MASARVHQPGRTSPYSYALLVLTRFRAALDRGLETADAVGEALATAGRSVLVAGGTVVISLMGLFLIGLEYMNGVALSASLAVLVVMAASVTLLPALLSMAGPRINRLRVPFAGGRRSGEGGGQRTAEGGGRRPVEGGGLAARWSRGVQRRPWTACSPASRCCWRSPCRSPTFASGSRTRATTSPGRPHARHTT